MDALEAHQSEKRRRGERGPDKVPRLGRNPIQVRESDVQSAALELLRLLPQVAWIERYNTGGVWYLGRRVEWERFEGAKYIRYCPPGHPDLGGALKTGHALYVEVKKPGEKPSTEQFAFLERAQYAGACAFWIDDARQCIDHIAAFLKRKQTTMS